MRNGGGGGLKTPPPPPISVGGISPQRDNDHFGLMRCHEGGGVCKERGGVCREMGGVCKERGGVCRKGAGQMEDYMARGVAMGDIWGWEINLWGDYRTVLLPTNNFV